MTHIQNAMSAGQPHFFSFPPMIAHRQRRLIHWLSWVALVSFLSATAARAGGTWAALTTSPPTSVNHAMVLSDGTILTDNGNGNCARLTPDIHGSYKNGTWTRPASMNYDRLFFASQVLTNGRVFVAGGEYGGGRRHAELFDPLNNVWTKIADPLPGPAFSDAISEILPNGNVLVAPVSQFGGNVIYNVAGNSWSTAASTINQNEVAWAKLPNDNIVTIDTGAQTSEHYVPSLNQWKADGNLPVPVYGYGAELGAGFLLPNGKVFYIGGSTNTAIYTPGATVTAAGSWVAGPPMVFGTDQLGAVDAPAAMMVNGKILCDLGPVGGFNGPCSFYEYDYVANSFTQVSAPGGGTTYNSVPYANSMLCLPDGSVLFIGGQNTFSLYIYTPDLTPLPAGQPAINSIAENTDGSYHLTGTNLNGISEGAAYGDDEQMNSNYPLVRMTNSVTGNVYYARTYNWNSTSVQTGSRVVTTEFTLPQNLPAGTYSLAAVANGNPSVATTFTYSPPPVPTGLTAASGSNAFVKLTWNASAGATAYNVKRSATSAGYFATIATLSSTLTSYTNTGLTNGITYFYKVAAVGSSGPSSDSALVAGTPAGPPIIPGATQVNLAAYYNRAGLYSDGRTFSGGLDNGGAAFSANLLGSSQFWNNLVFGFGPSNALDVVSCAGQTITLPAGQFNTLQFLATAVQGSQSAQTFTVTYTDNSTATFTQSFSDWANQQAYAGESKIITMPYRDLSGGTTQALNVSVDGYFFVLDQSKTVKNIILPANGNVILLALVLANDPVSVNLSTYYNRAGIYTDGTTFTNPATGGVDGGGYAFSGTLLGSSQTWTNTIFNFGPLNATNVISGANQTIPLPTGNYSRLQILASAVNGNQASQSFVVTYTDATTATFVQSVSDWFSPQSYAGEFKALPMGYRNSSNGSSSENNSLYIYGYNFALNSAKTVQSVRLPNNANVIVTAISLVPNWQPTFGANPFTLVNANAGQFYSRSMTTNASDLNSDALTYAKVSGPTWLNVALNGTISGVPANTDANTNTFAVSVKDAGGLSNTATLFIYVNGTPTFTANPFTLPDIAVGQNYAGTIATNASDPNPNDVLTFAKISGPAWLNVAANGALSGSPANSDVSTNTFVVSVTDPFGLSGTATLNINVNGAPGFTANPITLPDISVGQNVAGTIATIAVDPNSNDVLTFAKVSGPTWLSVAADGTLAGSPANSDANTNAFVVSVTDAGGLSNTAALFIYVNGAPAFTANPFAAPDAAAGQIYAGSIALNAVDPNPADTLTFAKVSGPAWLMVNTNGALSGTPTNLDANTNLFVVSVSDASGLSNTATLFLYVNGAPAFTVNPLNATNGQVGQSYSDTIATSAADPNPADVLTFAKVSGPAWLNVATNGILSGTPAAPDANTNLFVVSVSDTGGLSNTATLFIYVNGAPTFTLNPFSMPDVAVSQSYTGTIATNATDPNPTDGLTFAKVSGPAWLNVGTNGILSGTPAAADLGTNTFVVSVTDSTSLSNSATLMISVLPAPNIVSSLALQNGGFWLSWSGGTGPFQVQSAETLISPVWQNFGDPIGSNSLLILPTNAAAYFRVLGQ